LAAKAKVPTKKIKRDIKSLKKSLTSETQKRARATKRVVKKTASLSKEMERLKSEMDKLAKKKTPKKQLSEYNLFMRRQLRQGKNFGTAVRLWKAYKRGVVRPKVIRTVRIVRRVIAGPKIVTRTVVRKVPVTRTIVKRVPVTKTVVKTVRAAPSPIALTAELEDRIASMVAGEVAKLARAKAVSVEMTPAMEAKLATLVSEEVAKLPQLTGVAAPVPDEEVAIRLVNVFFQEVHRLGLKRRLELEGVILAYQATLGRIKGTRAASGANNGHAKVEPIVPRN